VRLKVIEPAFVEFIPTELEQGKLYISMLYATTMHLCACGCGCGNKVVLPLSPAEWQLYFDGESISLTPSIGNWQFPCRSHYWIKKNEVRWAGRWTDSQIAAGRQRDAKALDAYLTERVSGEAGRQRDETSKPGSRVRLALRRWLRG
jgi:hypothetical protein